MIGVREGQVVRGVGEAPSEDRAVLDEECHGGGDADAGVQRLVRYVGTAAETRFMCSAVTGERKEDVTRVPSRAS